MGWLCPPHGPWGWIGHPQIAVFATPMAMWWLRPPHMAKLASHPKIFYYFLFLNFIIFFYNYFFNFKYYFIILKFF
jgi:hypothetical protein